VSTEDTLPLVAPVAAVRRRRWLTVLLWLLIAPFAVWAAARVLGLESGYPTIQLLAFTPYVAVVSLVPLVLALLTKRIRPAVRRTSGGSVKIHSGGRAGWRGSPTLTGWSAPRTPCRSRHRPRRPGGADG
jgi:hypothetical protein